MMNEAFADILSESRKYKLALTLANQYIEQMEEEVRDAVFGNIGTLICFRVGPFDAEVLTTVFEPTFEAEDLIGLGIGQIYLTLMIDGVGSPPFSAETIPPIETPSITYRDDVVSRSREKYGRKRADIEAYINKKQAEFVMPPREKKERRDFRPAGSGNSYGGGYGAAPRRDAPQPMPHAPRSEASPRFDSPKPDRERREQDDPSRLGQAEAERNSLRAAIEKARSTDSGQARAEAVVSEPKRSPADVLRERQNRKPHTQKPESHAPRPTPPPPPAKREEQPHSGEISPQQLQQVINGTKRDADDL
jgi:hypothetical protein